MSTASTCPRSSTGNGRSKTAIITREHHCIEPRSLSVHKSRDICPTSARAQLEAIDLAGFVTTAMPRSDAIFHLVLIKPTHYDDDGYPIQWVKAAIPSNTLACLYALAEDASRRQALGPNVG